jgi:hypothetical protein
MRVPPKRDAARSSVNSIEPRDKGNHCTPNLARRRARAIADDRRLLCATLDLLAYDNGRRLRREHRPGGVLWTVTPIGMTVPGRIAARAIACNAVEIEDAGLFPGADCAQTFRLRDPPEEF